MRVCESMHICHMNDARTGKKVELTTDYEVESDYLILSLRDAFEAKVNEIFEKGLIKDTGGENITMHLGPLPHSSQ